MSILNSVIKVFVGDKAKKDVRELEPLLNEIKSFEAALESLDHNKLRQKTQDFKQTIKDASAELQKQIDILKEEVIASFRTTFKPTFSRDSLSCIRCEAEFDITAIRIWLNS